MHLGHSTLLWLALTLILLDIQKRRVIPNVEIVICQQEAIARGQPKKSHQFWIVIIDVTRVDRGKEVWCIRKIFTRPYVPSSRSTCRRMT